MSQPDKVALIATAILVAAFGLYLWWLIKRGAR
jgi:hypothetical protein